MHREGLNMSASLKVREYCSIGIPFVISSTDQDFPGKFPYILTMPSDESPIDFNKIIHFYQSVYADPKHQLKMREYAINNLDWIIKIRQLKDFFVSIDNS